MSYLLDTNIVSETVRRNPNKAVIAWLDHFPGTPSTQSIPVTAL